MRNLALALVMLFCVCAAARADVVRIGGSSLSYAVPTGFARADGLFPMDLEALDREFGMDTVVFATFIPEADLEARRKDPRFVPSWYVHLAYDAIFSKLSIGDTMFSTATGLVRRVIGKQYADAGFIKKLEGLISGALNRKLTIESMTQKGIVDEKPRYRSILAYGHGKLENDAGAMEDVSLATLTTFFLDNGKLVAIIQANRIRSEEDLPAFTEKALGIAAEITGR